jgi:fructose-1,6-bisphosphatase/inositol monophosphatase family enzyme
MEPVTTERGLPRLLCCHPYDLCTELIAREAGVIVTGVDGGPLSARLAVEPDVSWVGYANPRIRATVEPLLQAALQKRGLIDVG